MRVRVEVRENKTTLEILKKWENEEQKKGMINSFVYLFALLQPKMIPSTVGSCFGYQQNC